MGLETPPSPTVEVVEAESRHLPEIAAIYAEEVRSSAATFDLQAPDLDYWAQSLERVSALVGLSRECKHGDGRPSRPRFRP